MRERERLDYRRLATTGERVTISQAVSPKMSEFQELSVEFTTISSSIADFIDENPIDVELTYPDLKELLQKIENLRTNIRNVNNRIAILETQSDQFNGEFQTAIKVTKQFILEIKAAMKVIRQQENECKKTDDNIVKFILRDLELLRHAINSEFADVSRLDDSDLNRRTNDLPELRSRLKNFQKQVLRLLENKGPNKSTWYEELIFPLMSMLDI